MNLGYVIDPTKHADAQAGRSHHKCTYVGVMCGDTETNWSHSPCPWVCVCVNASEKDNTRSLREGDICKVIKKGSSKWGTVVTVVEPNRNNMVKVKTAQADIRSYTREDLLPCEEGPDSDSSHSEEYRREFVRFLLDAFQNIWFAAIGTASLDDPAIVRSAPYPAACNINFRAPATTVHRRRWRQTPACCNAASD